MKKKHQPPVATQILDPNALQSALEYHQTGQLAEAEAGYRQILQIEPNHPDALHFLGILLSQLGQYQQAVELINKAISISPSSVMYCNLGSLLKGLNQPAAVIENYQKSLALDPNNVDTHYNLGLMLQEQGNTTKAIEHYFSALRLNPGYVQAHYNLGMIFKEKDQLDVAARHFQEAIRLKPDYADAHNNLGLVFQEQNQLDKAIESYQRALLYQPDCVSACNNLGNVFQAQGKPALAVERYRQSLLLDPNCADTYSNLGISLKMLGQFDEAIESYRKALSLNPNLAEARFNLGFLLLYLGQFAEGWPHREVRYDPQLRKQNAIFLPKLSFPQWQGEPIRGKTLVIWPEQGLGDAIQFNRYAATLKELGVSFITLVCRSSLKSLFERLAGVDQVLTVEEASRIQKHDYWVFPLSLPLHCKTTLANIPATIPYLYPDQNQVQNIATELSNIAELKVGICWKGNPKFKNDLQRSVDITFFKPLFKLSGVNFFTLQPETRQEFISAAGEAGVDRGHEINAASFEETAALIMNLDVVISCDTSICHLAGALGKPVWITLPFEAEWRWMKDREDSPWYPTARLFRQTTAGDWAEVIERIAAQLKQLTS